MKDLKLTIELVPSSTWYSNVRSKEDEGTWNIITGKAYRLAAYKCEICGGVGPKHPVECHEIWEYNNGLQRLIGFQAICPACHLVKHIGFASMKGRRHEAIEQLMKVNDMEYDDVVEYVKLCFREWNLRSQIDWDVDVLYIKEYIT